MGRGLRAPAQPPRAVGGGTVVTASPPALALGCSRVIFGGRKKTCVSLVLQKAGGHMGPRVRAGALGTLRQTCPVTSQRSFLSCPPLTDGYAFSQDENGIVSQSEVIRAYDTTKQRPDEW